MMFQKYCKAHVGLDDMVLIYQCMNLFSHHLHELRKKNASEKNNLYLVTILAANENEAGFHPDPANPVQEFGIYQRLFHNTGTFFSSRPLISSLDRPF